MNRADALRALFAAQEDLVLAAWAAVLHRHEISPPCDVSPYELLEAVQDFFVLGLISAAQFATFDQRAFFSGKRPMTADLHRVLNNLRIPPHITEPPMSKTKFPDNPFSTSTELATKGSSGLATATRASMPVAHTHAPLNPFSPSREVAPAENRVAIDPFKRVKSLDCQTPNIDNLGDIDLRVFCCGQQLQMTVEDMQAEGPDGINGGNVQVIDRILHGKCQECQREHHHSVAEVIEHDRYR